MHVCVFSFCDDLSLSLLVCFGGIAGVDIVSSLSHTMQIQQQCFLPLKLDEIGMNCIPLQDVMFVVYPPPPLECYFLKSDFFLLSASLNLAKESDL